MKLTKFDVLAKPADFGERAAQLALSRWKWEVLDLIDGNRSLNAVATVSQLDGELIAEFAEECVSGELLGLVVLTQNEFTGVRPTAPRAEPADPAFPPEPAPALAAMPALEMSPALTLAPSEPPKAASLQERVAALKARALSAIQEASAASPAASAPAPTAIAAASPAPPPPAAEEVEFSLASSPKAEPAHSVDAIEFSL